MPLQKPVLQAAILAAFQKQSAPSANLASAQAQLAADLATAIDEYIKSAKITIPPGQLVVAGAPPGPGATVAPSPNASIS